MGKNPRLFISCAGASALFGVIAGTDQQVCSFVFMCLFVNEAELRCRFGPLFPGQIRDSQRTVRPISGLHSAVALDTLMIEKCSSIVRLRSY